MDILEQLKRGHLYFDRTHRELIARYGGDVLALMGVVQSSLVDELRRNFVHDFFLRIAADDLTETMALRYLLTAPAASTHDEPPALAALLLGALRIVIVARCGDHYEDRSVRRAYAAVRRRFAVV
ncbi:hypothetical protein BH10PSE17_BH10PSE17_24310 [soil metagenome]